VKYAGWILAVVAAIGLYLYNSFEKSEQFKTGTISIDELVETLEKTIEKVQFYSKNNDMPDFRYADLKLFVKETTEQSDELSVVIFESSSQISDSEVYEINVRLKPQDAAVSEYSDKLSELIIKTVEEVKSASKDKFEVTDVEVVLQINMKSDLEGGAQISFSDLSFGTTRSFSAEESNSLSIYFRD